MKCMGLAYVFICPTKICTVTYLRCHMYVQLLLMMYLCNLCVCTLSTKDINNSFSGDNVLRLS